MSSYPYDYPHICIPTQESALLDAETLAVVRKHGFQELTKAGCKCRACGQKMSKGDPRIAFRICLADCFDYEEIAAKFKNQEWTGNRHEHSPMSATTNYFIHAKECRA
jgi:hypothetical protein